MLNSVNSYALRIKFLSLSTYSLSFDTIAAQHIILNLFSTQTSVMASWMVTDDALFRIKVTLSSRRTAVEAFRDFAHAYSLEGTEWRSIASGVPCIIRMLESADEDSRYGMKYVLADVQSGLSVWEEHVTADANYYAYQGTFHTFKGKSGKRFGIQLSDEKIAVDILERMYDLSLELAKHEGDGTTSAEANNEANGRAGKRRIRRINTLSKKDISLPCNFVHISGVSKEKTTDSGEHLSSLLERKMKSLSAIVLPSHGRRNKKSPPTKFRSSTDISHERIFAKALDSSSQQSTPELENKGSNVVQRNTWNFGMLRKHSNGAIKAEKPRKGLFRRNSFSGISHFIPPDDVDISQPVLTNKPAALDHQRSPDAIKPCSPDQPSFASEPLRQRFSPSPPRTTVNENATSDHNPHYNTLPSSLRRSHSSAAASKHYIPRIAREGYSTSESHPRTNSMTLTRYDTEPAGIYRHNSQTNIPRSEFPQSCASTSDLVLRKPARSQYSHMKEDEITAAAAATIARYTERMAKALQQFDDVLLHDSPKTPHSSAVVC